MTRILLLALGTLLLAGCVATAPTVAPLTGTTVAASLQASALPVQDVRVFTAESDPNSLLGRPNQYTAKVSWRDTRGGDDATLEVFANAADLEARRAYTDAISKAGSAFAQYIYPNTSRLALLRLPHALTPDQAAEYERWLAAL